MFSADISKSEEISRWRTIDETLHCDFSAPKTFFWKSPQLFIRRTRVLSSNGFNKKQNEAISKITNEHTDTQTHTHTHTQTDCYNPPPMLGLMNACSIVHMLENFLQAFCPSTWNESYPNMPNLSNLMEQPSVNFVVTVFMCANLHLK